MIREFKPKRRELPRRVERAEIEALFVKGDFTRAYRLCREGDYELSDFDESLVKMGRKMYHSKPGELASLIYKHGFDAGYDVPSILRSQLRRNDHHGFLKNVYRFGVHDIFRSEVQDTIGKLKRPQEAQAWRVKFGAMSPKR